MIVKTGANYQNEGGYIEASREGNEVTIRTGDNEPVVVPNINGVVVDSVEIGLISKDPSFTGDIICTGISPSELYLAGYNVTTPDTHGLCYRIGTTISIQGETPVLKEGSKNCVITRSTASGLYMLLATGPDPIAILGVA